MCTLVSILFKIPKSTNLFFIYKILTQIEKLNYKKKPKMQPTRTSLQEHDRIGDHSMTQTHGWATHGSSIIMTQMVQGVRSFA